MVLPSGAHTPQPDGTISPSLAKRGSEEHLGIMGASPRLSNSNNKLGYILRVGVRVTLTLTLTLTLEQQQIISWVRVRGN